MIDTAQENVFSLREFARQLHERRGIERTYNTIRSWVQKGWSPRGQVEPVIKLEAISIAGIDHTSFEAFDRFLKEQAAAKHKAEMAS